LRNFPMLLSYWILHSFHMLSMFKIWFSSYDFTCFLMISKQV
jgi:hypothetical protein